LQTLKSTDAMARAMAGATKSMAAMNKNMNLPALHQIMKEFEKQNAKMDMVDEMMGDAMDDVFEVRLATNNT
jgi:division protein CdvB (Snf7/Vps24/ESCRT-III family)